MALTVTYSGNGNTGGTPPVDNNSYNANDKVQVQEPYLPRDGITVAPLNTVAGSLSRTGATFAYWNTMPDGSGTGYYWPVGGGSFQITSNVTLFAQWYITDGLTNGGATTHYMFGYDSSLKQTAANPTGPEPARTNGLIGSCEADYKIMSDWFGGSLTLNSVIGIPISVFVANAGGGANASSIIVLKPGASNSDSLRCLLVAEVTEYFMHAQNKGWGFVNGIGNEESSGEALSLFLDMQFALLSKFTNPYSLVSDYAADAWLNSSLSSSDPGSTQFYDGKSGFDYGSRADYVNSLRPYPGDGPGTGCSILFIYYLFHQLGFTINQIIDAAPGFTNNVLNSTATLRGVYQNLTGDEGDPFPFFKQLLGNAFPPDKASSIPAPNPDDPFPIAIMSFLVDKSTFGKDEVQDTINTSGGKFPKAFWLVVEGLSKNSFNSLQVTLGISGPFLQLAGITITINPDIDFENAANPQAPQRIRVPFDVTFSAASLAGFPNSGSATFELDSNLIIAGTKVTGSDTTAQFELVSGADPYFTNIDPTKNNEYYLSQDLRVFGINPSQNSMPIAGAPPFPNNNNPGPTDGYSFIQTLLSWLNGNYSDPAGPDPFISVLPNQSAALGDDSSVSPGNFNFAIAKVRLRGTPGIIGAATGVKVFFRLWSTETADADYYTNATYTSTMDAAGLPDSPLIGVDHQTLPFFASGNFSGNMDYVSGGANTRTLQIAAGKNSIWQYFGCFLNIYDVTNIIDGNPVQAWLNGTHHCIVAQIAYDGAPVVTGANPINSDKLAQRNLQITLSDNPGGPETHRIPQTFDIRPSTLQSIAALLPDELMIDWGKIPIGSNASIYWPQVLSSEVLALASAKYSSHTLSAADSNTIQCNVTGGVTYIPIPAGAGQNFAGLFTIDLPTTVKTGQEFNIIVRRISSRQDKTQVAIDLEMAATNFPAFSGRTKTFTTPKAWRYVVGTFQVKIPVTDKITMLFPEENTLAIMKWRLQRMSPTSRWYPVLQRYIAYISARITGLGGDPNSILPSITGVSNTMPAGKKIRSYSGKVCEVIYNCYGEFEGFLLDSCGDIHRFRSCEEGIGELVMKACKERLTMSVIIDETAGRKIKEIVIRCC